MKTDKSLVIISEPPAKAGGFFDLSSNRQARKIGFDLLEIQGLPWNCSMASSGIRVAPVSGDCPSTFPDLSVASSRAPCFYAVSRYVGRARFGTLLIGHFQWVT